MLAQKAITCSWPWSANDERTIDRHIKGLIAKVRRQVRLQDKTEYDHWGAAKGNLYTDRARSSFLA